MKKMQTNKIISMLLTFLLSFGVVSGAWAADVDNSDTVSVQDFNHLVEYVNSDEFRFVKNFDLMPVCNYDDFQPEKSLTRAEFARILCAIGGFAPTEGSGEFVDVFGNPYEGYIGAVNELNLMIGTDKYTFLPDNQISINQALKTFVVLLGYDVAALAKGGWPNGYLSVAKTLELTDCVETPGNAPATRGDIARIIYNSRNVELLNIVSMGEYIAYDTDEKETFLTMYLGVNHVTGVLTDNGITGLRDKSTSSGKRIKIDNTVYKIDDVYEVRNLIGRYVEAYYTNSGKGTETIVYIHLDNHESENEIIFDMTDFISLDGRTITYEKPNEKADTIKLDATANIIYNGKASKILTKDMFNYDYGTVTYVPGDYGNDDTIIIEGFISWYVNSVDREMETVRTTEACPKINGSSTLSIPVNNIGETIFIEDEHGLKGSFADIARYSVIEISKNGDIMFIKVAPLEAADKQLGSITKEDDTFYFTFTDEITYKVAPYYTTTTEFSTVTPGSVYYVYKNSLGYIVSMVIAENLSMEEGYLIEAASEGTFTKEQKIKVLTSDNTIEIFDVAEKINWSDEKNNTKTCKASDILTQLQAYSGPINYRTNSSGLVNLIYLPVEYGMDREMGRLGCIFRDLPGYKSNKNFGVDLLAPSSIKTFAVYASEGGDEDRYRCTDYNSSGFDEESTLYAYNYEPNSLSADFLYFVMEAAGEPRLSSTSPLIMIKQIRNAIYNEEEYCLIKGYNLTKYQEVTYYISPEDMKNVNNTMGSRSDYTLKVGDMILCKFKANDQNVIETVNLLWRSDMDNALHGANGLRGGIPDNLGYYDPNQSGISNPHIMYGGGDAIGYETAQHKIWTGSVYYADKKGGLVVSTKDLSYGDIEDGWDDTKFYKVAIIPDTGRYGFVSYKDDDIICREGNISDIRSYVEDGNDASRVIVIMNFGTSNTVIIINGEMK